MKLPCVCRETRDYRGKKLSVAAMPGAAHDCEYVRARSALVPEAVREATVAVPGGMSGSASQLLKAQWTRAFAEAMESVAYRRGLVA